MNKYAAPDPPSGISSDKYTVFTEGDDLYKDMLDSIENAEYSIALETYIFEPDIIGLRFIDALINRACSGVKIRLHLDAFGSMSIYQSMNDVRMT